MRVEKRDNSDGTTTYSLQYYEKGKRKRITQEEMKRRFGREIASQEDAEACMKMFEQLHEKEILQIKRRLEWENKYYNFPALVEKFTEWQKENAPNSWENNVSYLRLYVLPFFLTEKKLNSAELFDDHFEEYKNWLLTEKKIRGGRPMSYSGRNHAIKALNLFLKHLFEKNIILKFKPCRPFPEHLQNTRTIDDVFTDDEIKKLEVALRELGRNEEADFLLLLYYTGLRFNEAAGLSAADICEGTIDHEPLAKRLEQAEVAYTGYLVVDSQYVGKSENGRVLRKPLKGRKKIEDKHARFVPVTDKKLWNLLCDRLSALEKDFGTRGHSMKDYLLFNIDDATSSNWFKRAQETIKIRYRPWHCLRHTRATLLAGSLSDEGLIRLWLGHRSVRVFERYNHLYESMIRAAKKTNTFKLKKVA